MAGWTIRNLRGRQPVPARAGRPPAIRPPARRAGEVYVVLAGSGRVRLDDDVAELRPLDAVRVAAGTTRSFEAGPEGLEYLAAGSPGGANDADLVQGWWSD